MPIAVQEPRTVRVFTLTCDRNPKHTKRFELEPDETESEFEGWVSARHPDPGHSSDLLWFDSRECMGVFLKTYVRVLFGGPEELPKRRSHSHVEAAKSGESEIPEPTEDVVQAMELALNDPDEEPTPKRAKA